MAPAQAQEDNVVIVENESAVLAEINLSETHRITLSIESDNTYTIDETFNMELDRDTIPQSFVALKSSPTMTRTEVYDAVAGETWNEETRKIFQAVDRDLVDRGIGPLNLDVLDAAAEEAMVTKADQFDENVLDGMIEESAPDNTPESEKYAVRAGCSTPAGYDWQADDGWFKNWACGNTSDKCLTSGVAPYYSGARRDVTSSWIRHYGYAQAFCNKARFFISRTRHGPFGWMEYSVVRDLILDPKQGWGTECTGEESDTEWVMMVTHYSGSETPKRVAQACHHAG
jgi:hypothetical protein